MKLLRNRLGEFYDRLMGSLERDSLGQRRSRLLADLTGSVVEIGFGTGANYPHYSGNRLVALEPDRAMVERFREKFVTDGGEVDILLGRAESIPLASSSADVVVVSLALCSVEHLEGALEEIYRILRPAGKLIFMEHIRGNGFRGKVQDFVQPLWSALAFNCHPNRRTLEAVEQTGFSLSGTEFFSPFKAFPRPLRFLLRIFLPFTQGTAIKK